ncbi:hypothetical protein B0T20DRAFT_240529 [Sordaria brevicollis]|uniref:Casein kinase II beta 2 subunit n=1 Tax=Sordaria brevicollis TaxID=83679 RepID=A0AAE0UBI3_SORBR|nr:hypothetical protein B0T20DRAFT_240529 [Sordaria brevicollis]
MSPTAGGMWAAAALRVLGKNLARTSKMLRSKLAEAAARSSNPAQQLQPIAVRSGVNSSRQPIHPAAWLRQQKSGRGAGAKWHSTYANINATVRRYISNTAGRHSPSSGAGQSRFDRSKLPVSNTSRAVAAFPGRAPFASTLRPNLTGGALPRTAGGYSFSGAGRAGGKRYFSHTPAAPAQVVQNVSQAVRAFWLSGQRAHLDGYSADGRKLYRAVSVDEEKARNKLAVAPHAPGSFIDFHISPSVTALSPLGAMIPSSQSVKAEIQTAGATLLADNFLDVLSGDFARTLKDLAAVMADLKALAKLGDLPISLERADLLRVRFPGVDAETVERLCNDVGVQRGIIREDPDFDMDAGVQVALRFPYAPGIDKTPTSPDVTVRTRVLSEDGSSEQLDEAFVEEVEENPWLLASEHSDIVSEESEGYESMSPKSLKSASSEQNYPSEDNRYEGLEGIYKFLEECDRARAMRF